MSRRSLITALVVSLLSLMTLTGLVLAIFMVAGDGDGLGLGGRIAVVEVEGIIADDEGFLEDVRRLRRSGVSGWVIAINSPGGVVAPSQSIYQELMRIRTEDEVPMIASIGSVGASGGYYVALAADTIMALPGSITGSIGVVMEFPNVKGLMDKVGVEMEVVTSGDRKDVGSPFREMEEDDRAVLRSLVGDVHEQFVAVVAGRRGMTAEQVRPLADGRIFSGRQARELGLVDELGNLPDAIAMAGNMAGLGRDPRVVRPPRDELPWLAEALLGRTTLNAINRLANPLADTWPALRYVIH